MDFGPFVLLSLVYVLIGVRAVGQIVVRRREVFDRRFTAADRHLVDQAAFFVLIPVSVALHELGHAVAIRLLGGSIEGWGFYGFAGYVAYNPRDFDDAEQIVIAAAGTLVNLVLVALALALVVGRRPPLRAAYNQLLVQFSILSLLNALVLYPLLDLASGLNGDWRQMYDGNVPVLSALIFVLHATILGLAFWVSRNDAMQRRLTALTGAPRGRHDAGARRAAGPQPSIDVRNSAAAPAERLLRDAGERVTSGWPLPVQAAVQPRTDGHVLSLSWVSNGAHRLVAALAPDSMDSPVQLVGTLAPTDGPRAPQPPPAPILRRTVLPNPDDLTLALRLAMEELESHRPVADPHHR